MAEHVRRIHGLLCGCEMCADDPTAAELLKAFGWSVEAALVAFNPSPLGTAVRVDEDTGS